MDVLTGPKYFPPSVFDDEDDPPDPSVPDGEYCRPDDGKGMKAFMDDVDTMLTTGDIFDDVDTMLTTGDILDDVDTMLTTNDMLNTAAISNVVPTNACSNLDPTLVHIAATARRTS